MTVTRGSVGLNGHAISNRPVKVPHSLVPSTNATADEKAYILALHAERPDLTAGQLSRLYFRRFGKDKSREAIRAWIKKNPNPEGEPTA